MADERYGAYLEDLKTIKDTLIRSERTSLYEPWAFYTWGVLIILGGFIQTFFDTVPVAAIWVPVFVLGGLAETVTLVRSLTKVSLTVLSPTIRNFYLSFLGIVVALGFTVILMHRAGDDMLIPLALLAYLAVTYFMLAQLSYPSLYVEGFALVAAAAIIYALGLPRAAVLLASAIAAGISFIIAGITAVRRPADDE